MRDPRYWILQGRTPVTVDDVLEWAQWYETSCRDNARIVRLDHIRPRWYIPKIFVSTVFLGLDHNWGGGPPLLFETKVFEPGGWGIYTDRYATWNQAEGGHLQAIDFVYKRYRFPYGLFAWWSHITGRWKRYRMIRWMRERKWLTVQHSRLHSGALLTEFQYRYARARAYWTALARRARQDGED